MKKFIEVAHHYLGCTVECTDERNHPLRGTLEAIDQNGYCDVRMSGGDIIYLKPLTEVKPVLRPWRDMTEDEAIHFAWLCMDSEHHLEADARLSKEEIDGIELVFNDEGLMLDGDVEIYIGLTVRCFDGSVLIRKDGSISVVDSEGNEERPLDDIAEKVTYLLSCGFDLFRLIETAEAISSK